MAFRMPVADLPKHQIGGGRQARSGPPHQRSGPEPRLHEGREPGFPYEEPRGSPAPMPPRTSRYLIGGDGPLVEFPPPGVRSRFLAAGGPGKTSSDQGPQQPLRLRWRPVLDDFSRMRFFEASGVPLTQGTGHFAASTASRPKIHQTSPCPSSIRLDEHHSTFGTLLE